MPGEFMTLKEAAKFLNMSPKAVSLLVEKGYAKEDKDGRLLVKTSEIRDWLHRGIKDFNLNQLNTLEKDYGEHIIAIHPLLAPTCIKKKIVGGAKWPSSMSSSIS